MPPKVTYQPRVQICEGMTVKSVQKNGTEGQKLMAPVFDLDKDGEYDENEAKLFNSYNFKVEKDKDRNKITMFNHSGSGAEVVELVYDDYESDILNSTPENFKFKNRCKKTCSFGWAANLKKIVIDMVDGNVYVDGGNKKASDANKKHIWGSKLYSLNVKDADLDEISLNDCYFNRVNMNENVKDKGRFFDSSTKVKMAYYEDIVGSYR